MNTRKASVITAFTLLSSISLVAQADTVSGRLVGHQCAHAGKACPVDKLDPHIALERDFVLVKSNGDYLFLTNVPRDIKVRHALDNITIIGKTDSRFNAIQVSEFKVGNQGKVKTVWSQAMENEEYDELYGSD